jgi:predicted PurR-regulated permease PerM
VESGYMTQKIVAMFPERRRAEEARKVLNDVSESVRRYIFVKTGVSALTGVCCYAVMRLIGIDFAATWALLIFFLNFIPNIGRSSGFFFLPSSRSSNSTRLVHSSLSWWA